MFRKPLEPTEFVIELRTGRRGAVGKIQAANQNVADLRLNIAAVDVVRIAREPATTFNGIETARNNGDAVPALLAMPNRTIARLANSCFWKFLLWCLQFLK